MCSIELEFSSGTIDLSNNKLSGGIPTSLGNCSSLMSQNLGTNNLTGSVPKELGAVPLLCLLLNDNKLEGTFLIFVIQFQYLEVLNLANNNFEGGIAFGSLISLRILSLRSNKFNGSIPEEIIHFSKLQILDLSRNYFSGQLPRKIGSLEMLTSRPNGTILIPYSGDVELEIVIKGITIQIEKLYDYSSGIDLSCNILEGSIPEEISLLKGLSMLNLSHNGFSGRIPRSVGNLTGLDSLDLSFNKLLGQIPESLASLDSLGVLNLSHNNLSGRIPRGLHLDTLSGDS
ncbi:receptor-like protein 33 [Papaver somniferum]|uniref:receptor-like protein 33 n=1 Tax=Papaver somniferum TaxID=3469 RepID=UPI000E6FBC76|nr:receptor-like protein 33 [Papaver somniferum]